MPYFETTFASPLGNLLLIASGTGLRALLLPGEKPTRIALPAVRDVQRNDVLHETVAQLEEYFAGHRREFTLPLEMVGTHFEKTVWRGLQTIPFGATYSYAQLAEQLGRPKAARAVGRANSLNPLSIVVPCHRVIGKSGTLVGYAGGLDAKEALLRWERTEMPSFSETGKSAACVSSEFPAAFVRTL